MELYEPKGIAADIFKKRYALHENETWTDACDRVASYIATAEPGENISKWRSKFYDMLSCNLFMPGGRIMYGSGRPKGQLMNCFVIGTSDSREGWGKTVSDMIIICGTGGGLGINTSPIRPRGTVINGTGGVATGAVSLFEIVNAAGEVIKAGGGRRTALMFALGLTHGDIEEFLDKKLNLDQLNNANVSVWFDENPEIFFSKVKNDEVLDLTFKGKVVGKVPAKKIWFKIIENSLKSGEPGILNGYLFNKMSNISYYRPIVCTNPCQPGWATVLTKDGISTIGAIQIGDEIWSGKQWTKVINKVSTGVKAVNAYRTRAGTFYGTENHKIVSNGIKIEVKDAQSIDSCTGPLGPRPISNSKEIMNGLVIGDGMTHKASNNLTVLLIGENDQDYFDSEISHLIKEYRPGITDEAYEIDCDIKHLPKTYKREIPSNIRFGTRDQICNFLRGLYTANGSIVANRITFKTASFKLLEQTQELLSRLGITSYYTVNKSHEVEFNNGCYTCKESYDLNIGNNEGRVIFRANIGFIQKYKNEKLNLICEEISSKSPKINYDIVEIEYINDEQVYDITVEAEEHTYWTGGLLVSNCGEIGLVANDVCCLGALVLPRFIEDGEINYDLLSDTVDSAVRFLDNVITINNYPLQEIKETANNIRRIGLGVMGLHDLLLLRGFKYNSDKGLEEIDHLMNFIKYRAYEASIELAKEKGPFPMFEVEPYLKGGFAKKLKPSIRSKIREHGIRNCALLTIAPTGTTSMVSGVTSGIEPMFAPAYERKYRDGDALKKEVVIHPLLKDFISAGKGVKHFQGAFDLKLRDHFEMQRICQNHLDNACSKTINLPQGTSTSVLSDLYMEFFPELKGITVYPDGSREDQPLTPLTLEKAIELVKNEPVITETDSGKCRSGVCDI